MKSTDNEYLYKEHAAGLREDQLLYLLENAAGLLRTYEITGSKRLAKLIYDMALFHIARTRKEWESSPYQDVLDAIVRDIEATLLNCAHLPSPLNVAHKDVRNFNLFNAASSPWFGQNIIPVSSGVFWFSHVIARSLEPIIRYELEGKGSKFLSRYFTRKFSRVSAALITNNHTLSFSNFHFIYGEDSLIYGIETFIVAHEYAHLLIQNCGVHSIGLSSYYSDNIIGLALSDEEISADAFGLIILRELSRQSNDPILSYSPRLLFLIFDFYQRSGFIEKPVEHPSNTDRLAYIIDMTSELFPDLHFDHVDERLKAAFSKLEAKISRRITKEKQRRARLLNIFRKVQDHAAKFDHRRILND